MSNLLIVETNKIGAGYALANECCLNLRNSILEAFPLSGNRFVFLLQGQDLDKAAVLVQGHSGATYKKIESPHPELIKHLFNLKAPAAKESFGYFAYSNFPNMVAALNEILGNSLEVIEVRYGRLVQEKNFILASSDWNSLLKVEKLIKPLTEETQFIRELSPSFRDLIS